jgi:hypothetical protein
MKIVKRILVVFLGMFVLGTTLSAQTVTNVTATQVGKAIEISYDLDKAADIAVFMSTSGGITYRELRQVSGDVGKTVGPGHKTIVWDVLSEMDELSSDDIVFMVRVKANAEAQWRKKQRMETFKAMPNSIFLTLNVAYSPLPQWSYGFKVGQVKVAGWFVSAMSNFNFKGMYHPFVEEHAYGLTDRKTIRLSVQAGLAVRPWKPMTLLFGVGYGYRALTYKTIDKVWLSYPKRTYQGVDASFGLLFDIKGFAISAEAVTTNFKTIEARMGIGFCLPNKKHEKKQTVKVL